MHDCRTTLRPSPPAHRFTNATQVYNAAQASGAATKTETHVSLLRDPAIPGVDFVIRMCAAALSAKPKGPPTPPPLPTEPSPPSCANGGAADVPLAVPPPPPPAWRNPFLPYEEALWVAHLSPSHTLLLNKVSVQCTVVVRDDRA